MKPDLDRESVPDVVLQGVSLVRRAPDSGANPSKSLNTSPRMQGLRPDSSIASD